MKKINTIICALAASNVLMAASNPESVGAFTDSHVRDFPRSDSMHSQHSAKYVSAPQTESINLVNSPVPAEMPEVAETKEVLSPTLMTHARSTFMPFPQKTTPNPSSCRLVSVPVMTQCTYIPIPRTTTLTRFSTTMQQIPAPVNKVAKEDVMSILSSEESDSETQTWEAWLMSLFMSCSNVAIDDDFKV